MPILMEKKLHSGLVHQVISLQICLLGSLINQRNGTLQPLPLCLYSPFPKKTTNSYRLKSLIGKPKNEISWVIALNNKHTDVAPYIALTELYDRNIKYLDTIYNALTPEIQNHKYAKSLNEFIQERKKEETKVTE